MVETPTPRGMRTGKPSKRPEMMPSSIGGPYLAKGLSPDPVAAIQPIAMVTAAGTVLRGRRVTTFFLHYECPSLEMATPTVWMPRGELILCLFQIAGPR